MTIPAADWGLARIDWTNPPDPDPLPTEPYRAVLLIALVRSSDGTDARPLPSRTRVADLDDFWSFFTELADSDNAAMRAVRYV